MPTIKLLVNSQDSPRSRTSATPPTKTRNRILASETHSTNLTNLWKWQKWNNRQNPSPGNLCILCLRGRMKMVHKHQVINNWIVRLPWPAPCRKQLAADWPTRPPVRTLCLGSEPGGHRPSAPKTYTTKSHTRKEASIKTCYNSQRLRRKYYQNRQMMWRILDNKKSWRHWMISTTSKSTKTAASNPPNSSIWRQYWCLTMPTITLGALARRRTDSRKLPLMRRKMGALVARRMPLGVAPRPKRNLLTGTLSKWWEVVGRVWIYLSI